MTDEPAMPAVGASAARAQSRRTLGDTVIVMVGMGASTLLQLVVFALFGHFLGQRALGEYNFALAVASPVFLGLGLSLRVLYVVAPEHWKPGWFYRAGAVIALACAVISVAASWAMGASLSLAVYIALVKSLDVLAMAGIGVLQRVNVLRLGAVTLMVNAAVTLVTVVPLVILFPTWHSILVASVLGSAVGALMACGLGARPRTGVVAGSETGTLLLLLRRGLPVGAGNALLVLMSSLPVFFLAGRGALEAAAAYGVLINLRSAVIVVLSALQQVAMPGMAASFRLGRGALFLHQMSRLLGWSVALSVVITGSLLLVGQPVLELTFSLHLDEWSGPLLAVGAVLGATALVFTADTGLLGAQGYGVQFGSAAVAFGVALAVIAGQGDDLGVVGGLLANALGLVVCSVLRFAAVSARYRRLAAS